MPSTLLMPGVLLVVDRPRMTTPPQRPRSFSSVSSAMATLSASAVKMIGLSASPLASMSALTITTRPEARSPVAAEGTSLPLMTVPASMVSVAPGRTKMRPSRRYNSLELQVVLDVISAEIVCVGV